MRRPLLPVRRSARPAASLPHAGTPARLPSVARRSRRWAAGGALLGLVLALVAFAPAGWLAQGVASASGGRVQLADARGTVWRGDALLVLSGGSGSRDAVWLPERLGWRLAPAWLGLAATFTQPGRMPGEVSLRWLPGWGTSRVQVQTTSGDGVLGVWPAALLEGLGAPLNTLQPQGRLVLSARQLGFTQQQGRWQMEGQLAFQVLDAASLLSVISPLGSYEATLAGQPGGAPTLALRTLSGALQLQGQGRFTPRGLAFAGTAQAAPGQEAALANLLNIIGRRQGAVSLISIGSP